MLKAACCLLSAVTALLLDTGAPAAAQTVPPVTVTPELITAAQQEGRVVFYSSADVLVAEALGKAFEAKYPGINVQIERSGAERILQRINQEYAARIHAVDVVETSDIVHFLGWKRQGWLAPYLPADVARWPAHARDPDGFYATPRASFAVVGYNTKAVAAERAPSTYAELIEPQWQGKIVKAHPAYSGSCMTATVALSRALGWEYFRKLGRQRVMQVQSANDPPKKLALGERPLMFDGSEYLALHLVAQGAPVAIVYPREGTPLIAGGGALMQAAPHPNAGRLFASFLFSREGQQLLVDRGHVCSFHPDVQEPADRLPLSQIKSLVTDPLEQEKAIEEVTRKYAEYFGT